MIDLTIILLIASTCVFWYIHFQIFGKSMRQDKMKNKHKELTNAYKESLTINDFLEEYLIVNDRLGEYTDIEEAQQNADNSISALVRLVEVLHKKNIISITDIKYIGGRGE